MKKTFNKVLSLVLALVLTFSVASFVFAADIAEGEIITRNKAEEIALEYLSFKNADSVIEDSYYEYTAAYKVITTGVLSNNKVIIFICYVDKETGDVLYRTGNYIDITVNPFNPLTKEEALNYAMTAFGVNKNDVVVLTQETGYNDEGTIRYHFLFCEEVFERNECYVDANTGFIDDIKISKPGNIVDRLVLMIRVFIAKFNLFSILNR